MYEPSSSREKHSYTKKETTIEYALEAKESRLRRIPKIKKIEGQGIAIASDSEKNLYHKIEETQKREMATSRDEWYLFRVRSKFRIILHTVAYARVEMGSFRERRTRIFERDIL